MEQGMEIECLVPKPSGDLVVWVKTLWHLQMGT